MTLFSKTKPEEQNRMARRSSSMYATKIGRLCFTADFYTGSVEVRFSQEVHGRCPDLLCETVELTSATV